jgi:hypothetical protein
MATSEVSGISVSQTYPESKSVINTGQTAKGEGEIVAKFMKKLENIKKWAIDFSKKYSSEDYLEREQIPNQLSGTVKDIVKANLSEASLKELLREAFETTKVLLDQGLPFRTIGDCMADAGFFEDTLKVVAEYHDQLDPDALRDDSSAYVILSLATQLPKSKLDKAELRKYFKDAIKVTFSLKEKFDTLYCDYPSSTYGPGISSYWSYGTDYRQDILERLRDKMFDAGLSREEIKQTFIEAAVEKNPTIYQPMSEAERTKAAKIMEEQIRIFNMYQPEKTKKPVALPETNPAKTK